MDTTVAIIIVVVFVFAVLGVVAYTLFELSPFASHADTYRDPVTHQRLFESPHLETRDEFEQQQRERQSQTA